MTELAAGDHVHVGRIDLEVVCPSSPVLNAATNEASVVMVAREGSASVLLTGDAEAGVLQPACDAGRLGKIDVLKVGHHGSAISLSQPLLDVLAAWLRLSSALERATASGIRSRRRSGAAQLATTPVYRTDRDGDVTVRFTSRGCEVSGSTALGVGEQRLGSRPAEATASAVAHETRDAVCDTEREPDRATQTDRPETHGSIAFRSQDVYLIYGSEDLLLEQAVLASAQAQRRARSRTSTSTPRRSTARARTPTRSSRRATRCRSCRSAGSSSCATSTRWPRQGTDALVDLRGEPIADDTILVLVAKKLAKNTRLYKAVDKLGGVIGVRGAAQVASTRARCSACSRDRGKRIDARGRRVAGQRGRQRPAPALRRGRQGRRVRRASASRSTAPTSSKSSRPPRRRSVFELGDALGESRLLRRALRLLDRLLGDGESVYGLHALALRHDPRPDRRRAR